MLRGLIILILFTVVDTIFQLKRLNFPCFDTILHSLFCPSVAFSFLLFSGFFYFFVLAFLSFTPFDRFICIAIVPPIRVTGYQSASYGAN